MATETVKIIITSTGGVVVKKDIDAIGKSSEKTAKSANMLKGVLAGLFSAGAVAALAKYGDQYTNLSNKLRLVTKDGSELASVQEKLFTLANKTYQSVDGVATIYSRASLALKDLGYSTQDTLAFTETLSKATALSGASAEAASAGLLQLSQGLASGTLRGEELNSVLEQIPYVAQALAKGLGVPIGQLRAMGAAGELTSKKIIEAFKNVNSSVNTDFAKITPTISQGLEVINNGFIRLAGVLQDNTGIFGKVGQGLVFLGNNMEALGVAVTPVAALLATFGTRILLGYLVTGLVGGAQALISLTLQVTAFATYLVGTAIPAVISFSAAFIANPITLTTIAVVGLLVVLYKLADFLLAGNEQWESYKKSATDAIDGVVQVFTGSGLGQLLTKGVAKITIDGKEAAAGLRDAGKQSASVMDDAFKSGGTAAGQNIAKSISTGSAGLQTSIEKGGKTAGAAMLDGTTKGGTAAGNSINGAMMRGTLDLTGKLSSTITESAKSFVQLIKDAWTTVLGWLKGWANSFIAFLKSFNPFSSGSGDGGSKSASKPAAFARGGSFMVGGNGGTDSQTVQFRASPDERVTVETPAQQRTSDNQSAAPATVVTPPPAVYNVFDLNMLPEVFKTAAGRDALVNVVKANRTDFMTALGIA